VSDNAPTVGGRQEIDRSATPISGSRPAKRAAAAERAAPRAVGRPQPGTTRVPQCHCGRPIHYADQQTAIRMIRAAQKHGEFIIIAVGGRFWKVQRHYFLLHAIEASELPNLGFEEVTWAQDAAPPENPPNPPDGGR